MSQDRTGAQPTRVLFVEDAETDIEIVKRMLTRAGMSVDMLGVATEAELRRAIRDDWDIILSDFNLPALDAFGVLQILREESVETPCILVSGTVGEEIATQTMRAGARDYVLKSNLARLPAVVRREIAEAQDRARRTRLAETQQALRDVAFEAGRHLDPAVLASYVLDRACALLGVDSASLYWWNDKRSRLEQLAASGAGSAVPTEANGEPAAENDLGGGASRLAFQSREPVIIPDYRAWPERTTETSGSAVAVPAMAGYRALGALYVHSQGLRTFTDEEAQALQLLASQVAPALMIRHLLSALRASEQRFETVFRRNPVGIIVTRASDNVVLDVNDSLLELIGYGRDELLGQSARALGLMSSDQEKQLTAVFEVGLSSRGTETQIRDRHGAVREVVLYTETIALDEVGALLSTVVDITARRSAERMLRHQSLHDELTGLPNRAYLYERVDDLIKQPGEMTLLFVDLDDFTAANDSLGHHGADLLLTQVARRLREHLPALDLLARSGGDEFAAVLTGSDASEAPRIAREILSALDGSFVVGDSEVLMGASIGIASFPGHAITADELLKCATLALQTAKTIGGTWVAYESVRRHSAGPARLFELRRAIDNGELRLLYQPIVEIPSRAVVGVEALLRWQHPRDGLISPLSFLPAAERTTLMNPLLEWVLRNALTGTKAKRLPVAINLGTRNLVDGGLPALVAAALRQTDRFATDLTLEITESGVMSNPDGAVRVLGELREMGCRLSIDDFGTGYSSLAYLQRLPVHELKIDGSFVRGIPDDRRNTSIVQASIALAHGLGLKAVGEGVEDEANFGALATLGCDRAQGFLLARPAPFVETV